jgi:hypothetical protein
LIEADDESLYNFDADLRYSRRRYVVSLKSRNGWSAAGDYKDVDTARRSLKDMIAGRNSHGSWSHMGLRDIVLDRWEVWPVKLVTYDPRALL